MTLKDTLKEERDEYATMLDEWVVGFGKYGTRSACDDWLIQHDTRILNALLEEIEGKKPDERKVAIFGEWKAETYEDKMLVRAALTDLAEIIKSSLEK